MTATIRRADVGDIPILVELTDEIQALHAKAMPDVFVYPQDRAGLSRHFAEVLASEAKHVLLLEVDGRVGGHVYAEVKRVPASPFTHPTDYLYVHQLGVRAGVQGHGLGRHLLAAASELARSNGVQNIRLDYFSFNDQARRFYAKNGFRVFRESLSMNLATE